MTMKILILQDDFPPQSFGGAGIIAFNLAKSFQEKGHSVSVVTTVQSKIDEGEIEYEGLKIFRIYSKYNGRLRAYISLYNPQTIKKVKKIFDKIKPDVVHAHNIHYHLSYYCLKLAKKSGAKVFLTAHDVMLFHYGKLVECVNPKELSCPTKFNYKISAWKQIKKFRKRYNPFRNLIIRHYLKYANKIFTVSGALKEALKQNGIKNTEIVYNGINTEDWQVAPQVIGEFKKKYNLIGKKVVLSGGRLSDAKGGTKALEMLAQIVKKVPNIVLLVAGNIDGHVRVMKKQAKILNIEQNLIFTDWINREEIKIAYAVSDVVLVPSVCFDSFPTINLEAMASMKPVVATCYGGTPEIVIDNATGYIVNPVYPDMIAGKILDLINNPQKAKAFGKAGYERVSKEFSLEKSVKEYLEKFVKLL